VSLFDVYDWAGLAILGSINVVQIASALRGVPSTDRSPFWFVGCLVEPPSVGQLIFWRQYKLVPLLLAFVTGFLMLISPGAVVRHYKDPVELALNIDAQLFGITIGLYVLLALLNGVLLAAPSHARKLIAELHSVSPVQAVPSSSRQHPAR
jgi:hypothetical protein